MSRSGERIARCPLCGHEFQPAGLPCHVECPLGQRCGLICCPNCGYQVVDESRSGLVHLIGRLFPVHPPRTRPVELRSPGPEQIPLTHVPRGEAVAIGSLREMPAARSARLSAFGVVPGSTVSVLQRRPVPVIRIGETEIALSEEILGQIWVERPQRAAARWTTTAG